MTSPSGMTLEEALSSGQGTERPFRCSEHDDTMASASVNVEKMVWFCHACHASGAVDGKAKAPSLEILESMLNPEQAPRIYPDSWLELHHLPVKEEGGEEHYWVAERGFPLWVCHALNMGETPFTREATFAVRTPQGLVAGVGLRRQDEDKKSARYLYPYGWSASMVLHGLHVKVPRRTAVVLVEGAADAVSLWQVGIPAYATYGAGLHKPQVELVSRLGASLILLGFDTDKRGEDAVTRGFGQLKRLGTLARARWPKSDPAATPPSERRDVVLNAVRRAGYSSDLVPEWDANIEMMQADYASFAEGAA